MSQIPTWNTENTNETVLDRLRELHPFVSFYHNQHPKSNKRRESYRGKETMYKESISRKESTQEKESDPRKDDRDVRKEDDKKRIRIFHLTRRAVWGYIKDTLGSLSLYQFCSVVDRLLYLSTSCSDRIRSEMSQVTWNEFFPHRSIFFHDAIVRSLNPFLGTDWRRASVSSTWEEYESTHVPKTLHPNNDGKCWVMDRPTSEGWFDPWHEYLTQEQSVHIFTHTTVLQIHVDPSTHRIVRVDSMTDEDQDGSTSDMRINVEWYPSQCVWALPLYAATNTLITPLLAGISPTLRVLKDELAPRMWQCQIGVQIFWPCKMPMQTGLKFATVVLTQSPWQLIIEPQGSIWKYGDQLSKIYKDDRVHDIWSVTVCDTETRSHRLDKSALECTRSEISEECMFQLRQYSDEMKQVLDLKQCRQGKDTRGTRDVQSFYDIEPVLVHVWEAFVDLPNSNVVSISPCSHSTATTIAKESTMTTTGSPLTTTESPITTTESTTESNRKIRIDDEWSDKKVEDEWSDKKQRVRRLRVLEPKSSPNAGCIQYRPPTICPEIHNLTFATAYTQNRREMILMDAAAEAGVKAASRILDISPPSSLSPASSHHMNSVASSSSSSMWNIEDENRSNGTLFGLSRNLDYLFLQLGLPHLSSFLCGSSLFAFLFSVLGILFLIYHMYEMYQI